MIIHRNTLINIRYKGKKVRTFAKSPIKFRIFSENPSHYEAYRYGFPTILINILL